jgi:hypothetical protein
MLRPDVIASSRPAGQEDAKEVAGKGEASEIDFTTHGAKIIPFCRPQGRCDGCGQHLAASQQGATCPRCRARDALLRAMSLRRQALGDLQRAGGW